MPKLKKKRVFVGLSGGVDSAVAAALLKRQGYDVVGVFMRFWKDPSTSSGQGENACCSVESQASALAVAQKLSIPFYIFNFEREFKKAVVDYFLGELRASRTPNPCVICNPQIKFGLFLEKAKKLGADFVATGHYARLRREIPNPNFQFPKKSQGPESEAVKLYQAKDKNKDQSYFLHRLTQEQLNRVLFPLAGYTKAEVYKLAKQWRLPHQAHQSFDVCFIKDYGKFLSRYLKMRPGRIVSTSVIPARFDESKTRRAKAGTQAQNTKPGSPIKSGMTKSAILGQHQGLPLYTIGQRASIGGPGPFFVVRKDVKKNILYVSNNERDLYQREMEVEKVNWLAGQAPKLPLKCRIKIRYGGEAAAATLRLRSGQKLQVIFGEPQRAVTPGQSAVFYGRGGEVLGGGVIV